MMYAFILYALTCADYRDIASQWRSNTVNALLSSPVTTGMPFDSDPRTVGVHGARIVHAGAHSLPRRSCVLDTRAPILP